MVSIAIRSTYVNVFFSMTIDLSENYTCSMVSKAPVRKVVACCSPVSVDAMSEPQAADMARSFAALSDPIRLRLLSIVASAGDEVCACDLLEPSGRSQPTVSHHMKILFDAGLVTREKRGLWVWYRVVPDRLEALRAVLA
jgi:ArsR family transcriptional regulator, arsenate/arsenite/antimonite-responsive transcriptional repressor